MFGTPDPGNITHRMRPAVHGVQMTPPAFPMIISGTPAPACGTGQAFAAIVGDMNTHFPLLVDNFRFHNLPGRMKVNQSVEGLTAEVKSWLASSCHRSLSLSLKLM